MDGYKVQVAGENGGATIEYQISNPPLKMIRLKDVVPSDEYTSLFVVDGALDKKQMDIAFEVDDVSMLILQTGMIRVILKSNGYLTLYEKEQASSVYWANALAEVLKLFAVPKG